jgi:hypothetical protein
MVKHSHTYEFDFKWLASHLGLPLLFIAIIAGLLHVSASLLPAPRATWDMDRTIMATKADLALKDESADIVLIGDSSCLMNIDASQLSELTGRKVVNLGTVSFLDMKVFSNLLERYLKAQTKAPSEILLMVHPDFLRRSSPSRSHVQWINDYMAGKDHATNGKSWTSTEYLLGVHVIRGRLLSWLPRPLSAAFGSYFGFTRDLETYMWEHRGSAVDPRTIKASDLKGSKEYRISTANLRNADTFTSVIPEDVQLTVALSPTPSSFADNELTPKLASILQDWKTALKADDSLDSLPLAMEDAQFANKTHLNPVASKAYTLGLSRLLIPQ